VDAQGLPVAAHLAAADVHETRLVEPVLKARFVKGKPQRLGGDRAYDSDPVRTRANPLDETLAAQGVAMIARHRSNRTKSKTQDGRVARRLKRRWKAERCNAWLKGFRRLRVRHEWHVQNFLGLVHLACALILLRNVLK
jgi:transposase